MLERTETTLASAIISQTLTLLNADTTLPLDNQETYVTTLANVLAQQVNLGMYANKSSDIQDLIRDMFAKSLANIISRSNTPYVVAMRDDSYQLLAWREVVYRAPGLQYNQRRNGDNVDYDSIALPNNLLATEAMLAEELADVISNANTILVFPIVMFAAITQPPVWTGLLPQELRVQILQFIMNRDMAQELRNILRPQPQPLPQPQTRSIGFCSIV